MPRLLCPLLTVLCLATPAAALAQSMPGIPDMPSTSRSITADPDAPPREGGWDALARLLEAAKPSVDTSIPLTPSQITDAIEALLNQGRNQEALARIRERMAQEEHRRAPGTD